MSDDQSKSGSGAGVVVVVVLLLLLGPCVVGTGLLVLGGVFYASVDMPQPVAMPGAPAAAATFPVDALLPAGGALPANTTITVNSMQWSGNLFDQSEEILTLARYDQIRPGMSYDEVLTVLAIPENKRPPDIELVGPTSDVELKWFGGENDELSITVKLKGKVVTDKSQSGLK
jgi:hypothetical protein